MRTMLLGDIGNRLDIQDAEQNIGTLQEHTRTLTRARGTQEAAQAQLQGELSRQKLAITALTRFLIAKGVVSESELEEFIREVDAEDGAVDGKLQVEIVNGHTRLVRPPIQPGTFRKTT